MRTAPKLSLKKETLVELSTDELGLVHGGDTTGTISTAIDPCPTQDRICDYISVRIRPCPTDPRICP